jgi:hypothetical protein
LRSLVVDRETSERPSPIGFWKYPAGGENKNGRWIDEELSRGTTPTANNPAIDFQNYKHPKAKTSGFAGQAAWTENRYKLVVGDRKKSTGTELFDLTDDPYEKINLAEQEPSTVMRMLTELRAWQASVEKSLRNSLRISSVL